MSELGVERPTSLPLPLTESQEERHVHFGDDRRRLVRGQKTEVNVACGRDSEYRPKRLRSSSFSAPGDSRYGTKRRKRCRVLPSKFLLGGNITDPLNLGSLEDRDESSKLGLIDLRQGAIAKKSAAVKVIIPPNINDPLNLDVSSENEDSLSASLLRQIRRRRRSRKRKRRLSEPCGNSSDCEPLREEHLEGFHVFSDEAQSSTFQRLPVSSEALKPLSINTELPPPTQVLDHEQQDNAGPITPVGTKPSSSASCPGGGFPRPTMKKQRSKSDNKIVSPVIPQPGVERKRHPSHCRQSADQPHLSQQNLKPPKKFNPKNELFQYGNYNKYYGYRNPDMSPDIRLDFLKPEWFHGKEVLDVGCNIGHITLTIARDFNPKRVMGIDIDKKLVNIAQKNIKHYRKMGDIQEATFPKSLPMLYGPLKNSLTADGARRFPHNIKFVHANYVLESDELLETVRPEFDVIVCFSITKWIHLNWGDGGLKRFFRRIFYNLNPGGRFILEPQGWPSYNRRRKLTKRIFENYKNIRLFPEKFNDYLLHEVGFSTSEKIITPQHTSRGFQRPIIVYTKAGSIKVGSNDKGKCNTKQVTRPSQEGTTARKGVGAVPLVSEALPPTGKEATVTAESDRATSTVAAESDRATSTVTAESSEAHGVNVSRGGDHHSSGLLSTSTGEGKAEIMDSAHSGDRDNEKPDPETSVKEGKASSGCDVDANSRNSSCSRSETHMTHSSDPELDRCVPESEFMKHLESPVSSTKEEEGKTHASPSKCDADEGRCSQEGKVLSSSSSSSTGTRDRQLRKDESASSSTKAGIMQGVQINVCGVSKDSVSGLSSMEFECLPSTTTPKSPAIVGTEERP